MDSSGKKSNFEKHGEIVKFLETEYQFTHEYVNFVTLKSLQEDAGSYSEKYLISNQYKIRDKEPASRLENSDPFGTMFTYLIRLEPA